MNFTGITTDRAVAERVMDRPAPKRASRDVFVYFDNDAKVRAPFDAQKLIARVSDLLAHKSRSSPPKHRFGDQAVNSIVPVSSGAHSSCLVQRSGA